MKIIFATTNNRKLEDLINVIKDEQLDLEVISMTDIGWDLGEIEENGTTIQENSLIKANAIYEFCKARKIKFPIITDDAGLFVDALGGAPGIYTARYADEELKQNPDLSKDYVLTKLLHNMSNENNRRARYKCAVTVIFADGKFKQFIEKTEGFIDDKVNEPIKKPYFYSLFIDELTNKPFNSLSVDELKDTYRFKALKAGLKYLNEELSKNSQMG